MSHSEAKEILRNYLGNWLNAAQINRLLLSCSLVRFDEGNQYFFKKGDEARGFYWLLEGKVCGYDTGVEREVLRSGQTVGMIEFLAEVPLSKHWKSSEPSWALYIDRATYGKYFSRNLRIALLSSSCFT